MVRAKRSSKKALNKANSNQPQTIRPQRVNVGRIRVSLCKTNPIPGRRGRTIGGLATLEAGTRTSLAHAGSGDEYGVSLGCVAGNSSEPMAQAYPDVPAEEDQEPKKAPNKANLKSTQPSPLQKVESGLTGPAGQEQSHL